jgi:thiol-disulfide isomerase/thioredoxin
VIAYAFFEKSFYSNYSDFAHSVLDKEKCAKDKCGENVGFGYSNNFEVFTGTNLHAYDAPTLILFHKGKSFALDKKKYPVNLEGMKSWWNTFKTNGLDVFVTSEEEPKEQGLVKVMTYNTWKNFLQIGKSVMIDFWKPECSYCISLEPIYDAIALEYQQSNVILTKYNVVKNQIPKELSVPFLPTLIFYPNCQNIETSMEYTGERTFDAIKEFIDKNKCK